MGTVLITGASRGIGEQIALLMAEKGHNVIINYNKNAERAEAVRKKIGKNCIAVKADVSKPGEVGEMLRISRETFGFTDILVNNAGVSVSGLVTDVSDEEYEYVMGTNLRGVFNCCRTFLPDMIREKYGRIINISSMWGRTGASCEVVYSASKAGVIGFTKALARETAPSGVTVNCIAPGVIDTEMNACYDGETMRALIDETPVGRLGTPLDVALAAEFFSRRENSFITGQVLGVDGAYI